MKTTLENFIVKTMEGNHTSFIDHGKYYEGKVLSIDFTDNGVEYTLEDDEGYTHDPILNESVLLDLSEICNSI